MSSCATIVEGTTQTIAVNTPGVTGATCVLTSGKIGSISVVTPGTVTLKKSSEAITVQCTKECYSDGVGVLGTQIATAAAGNIIAGGVNGVGIDAATGAAHKYDSQASISMTPIPKCKPKATAT